MNVVWMHSSISDSENNAKLFMEILNIRQMLFCEQTHSLIQHIFCFTCEMASLETYFN